MSSSLPGESADVLSPASSRGSAAEVFRVALGLGLTSFGGPVALVFVFLPGILIALAGLPLWAWLGHHPAARGALAGINAAVVGVLGAALYNPIWVSAIGSGRDVAIALAGLLLLERWRVPPLIVVLFCAAAALLSAAMR